MPSGRQAPGWYQDPDDPGQLRYWGGWAWSGRRRPRPGWTIATGDVEVTDPAELVSEGPVRPAAVAAAAEAALATPGRRRTLPTLGTTPAWDGPSAASLGRPPRPPARVGRWPRPRRPLALFCAVAAIGILIVAVSFRGTRPPAWSLSNASWVANANQACTQAGGPAGSTATSSTPALLSQSAQRVNALEARLRSFQISDSGAVEADRWLDDLHQWASDAQTYAQLVSTAEGKKVKAAAGSSASGPNSPATTTGTSEPASTVAEADRIAAEAAQTAATADLFAVTNGLQACTIDAHNTGWPVLPQS